MLLTSLNAWVIFIFHEVEMALGLTAEHGRVGEIIKQVVVRDFAPAEVKEIQTPLPLFNHFLLGCRIVNANFLLHCKVVFKERNSLSNCDAHSAQVLSQLHY